MSDDNLKPDDPKPEVSANESAKESAAADAPQTEANAASDGGAEATPTGPLTEDHVREELKKVIDPELFVNIVDLGLIYDVDLKEKAEEAGKFDVSIDMTLTSPACPAGPQLVANSKNVVSQLGSVGEVEVKIVLDPPWSPDKMTDDARDQLGIF